MRPGPIGERGGTRFGRRGEEVPTPPDPQGPIVIVPADPRWADEFRTVGQELRDALGATARRIDHVGSTSVRGLAAKPIVDVQVSVETLEPLAPILDPLTRRGYVFHPANSDRTKRFFLGPPGRFPVHLHVRRVGSFDEQLNLLFRDYLRAHPDASQEYARAKWALAERFRDDREGYVLAKQPTVWQLLLRAHTWAQETAWAPGPTDA